MSAQGPLAELQAGLEELRAADLPSYKKRIDELERRVRDIDDRLRPLLWLLRTDI
jgi:polyhydroxyalkanoate synthesis regulator phasin